MNSPRYRRYTVIHVSSHHGSPQTTILFHSFSDGTDPEEPELLAYYTCSLKPHNSLQCDERDLFEIYCFLPLVGPFCLLGIFAVAMNCFILLPRMRCSLSINGGSTNHRYVMNVDTYGVFEAGCLACFA